MDTRTKGLKVIPTNNAAGYSYNLAISRSISHSHSCFPCRSGIAISSLIAEMAPPPSNAARIAEAKELSKNNPPKAEAVYKDVLSKAPGSNEQALRDYENALVGLGELYRDNKKVDELAELVKSSRSTLSSFAKAKTAKLGRHHCLV